MLNRFRSGIAAAVLAVSSLVSSPFRTMLGAPMAAPRPRRNAPLARPRNPLFDPKVVRMMQLQAGIKAGMDRRTRRAKARVFAGKLTASAQSQGLTKGLPRAEVRRREKFVAQVVGGELVRG